MAVFRVKEAYSFDDANGVPVTVRAGTLLADDDPRAIGRERFLEPAEDAAARTAPGATGAVETATAAPGERRTTTRATKPTR